MSKTTTKVALNAWSSDKPVVAAGAGTTCVAVRAGSLAVEDFSVVNEFGETAGDLAVAKGHAECAALIRRQQEAGEAVCTCRP